MSLGSFLSHIGADFKNGLKKLYPVIVKVTQVAQAAAPEIAILNPLIGMAFTTTVGVVASVEQKFAAMGAQSGTGPQKLADATTILTPLLSQVLADAGQSADMASIQKYINAVVAFLNNLPAPVVGPGVAGPTVLPAPAPAVAPAKQ